jgi:hypothetical protein
MKTISPIIIALVLWLLFWATNAFAMLKSPYPQKAQAPDQITLTSNGGVGPFVGMASKPK